MFSFKYIDMCEKAKEIQDLWKVNVGDYYCDGKLWCIGDHVYVSDNCLSCDDYNCDSFGFNKSNVVWIPKLEQLQKMLDEKWWISQRIFYRYVDKNKFKEKYTIEEVCLICVMEKKFNKRWKNNEWIDIRWDFY